MAHDYNLSIWELGVGDHVQGQPWLCGKCETSLGDSSRTLSQNTNQENGKACSCDPGLNHQSTLKRAKAWSGGGVGM